MPPLVAVGSPTTDLSAAEKRACLQQLIDAQPAPPKRVLLVPPDGTRRHSDAGVLTPMLYELLGPDCHVDVLPALGTHVAMEPHEIRSMFGDTIPLDRFIAHDWRQGLTHMGTIPAAKIREWSAGKCDYPIEVEVNSLLVDGGYDLIVSIGQIVPHEVVGMANYTKNIMIGVGGSGTINRSHFVGAVADMEKQMGRADTPVRRVFNYGMQTFCGHLPIVYILTVMGQEPGSHRDICRGLYIGADDETFAIGCRLSQQVNLTLMDERPAKVIVYLDPASYKSTWLGNKSVYRTRMMIADDGDLIVLAPGLREFGEDPEIDRLIRKYGYVGTPKVLQYVEENADMTGNLSAAAHLIHGSSEGRFRITYCPGPQVTQQEIESVGYQYADLDETRRRYQVDRLQDGWNTVNGERIFYISNPALGLWAPRAAFA